MCREFDVGQMLGRRWFTRIIRAVRKFLLVFLLALMPLQLTWAAVLGYCQTETGTMAAHFVHQAHACVDVPFTRATAPEPSAPSVDLHHHHVSDHGSAWVGQHFQGLTVFAWHAAGAWPAQDRAIASSAPPSAIERPKWPGSSAFCGGV